MIIVCDSCGARFHLADGRVGPRGAKVRCSNCHHSFQVAPPDKKGNPPPGSENSPASRAKRPKSAGDAGQRRRDVGDPDLDNPEFLFDEAENDHTPTSTTIPEDVPFSKAGATASGAVTQKHEPPGDAGEDDLTPAGKRAPTPLMGLDPEVSARQEQLNRNLDEAAASLRSEPGPGESQSLFDFARDDDFESTPIPGREPSLGSREPQTRSAVPEQDAEPDTLVRLVGDGLDESISRWDAPVESPRRRRSEPAPGQRVEVLRPSSAREPDAPRAVAEPLPARRGEPRPVSLPDPESAPVWMQLMAALVGLALIAAGARASLRQTREPQIAAAGVEGMGWSATGLHATPARDAAGDLAIEVAGALQGPSGAAFPSVMVTPLDARGRPVGAAVRARVAQGSFSALLGEPTVSARSFRIELAPAQPEPRLLPEATTAAVPAPPEVPAAQVAAPEPVPEPAAPAP